MSIVSCFWIGVNIYFGICAKIKRSANRSGRPEKRKPRLSLNKSNQNGNSFNILTCGICIFAKFKIRMSKKGIIMPVKKKLHLFLIIWFVEHFYYATKKIMCQGVWDKICVRRMWTTGRSSPTGAAEISMFTRRGGVSPPVFCFSHTRTNGRGDPSPTAGK